MPLSTFTTFRPDRPGSYRYTLLLDTTGGAEEWTGRFGQEQYRDVVLSMLSEVPEVVRRGRTGSRPPRRDNRRRTGIR
ncbi:hypothetical protein [Blastococcus saxobsidens]|uniref:Uncharacterized protein n=1 Tax=Blastococcus saxobsidens (strain DD2) TaxID=1146883 RepID=H6RJX6_BLASD|nr:hypothetical protein [Blastococcus saxobsidens]CCG03629.1 protein of unknown function [Blastococcus saxobsidens DD2]